MVREPGRAEDGPQVIVVVPTLNAGEPLSECLDSLEQQSFANFEVIVVDNSGRQLVLPRKGVRVIANQQNVGFGAAANQAFRESKAPFLAVLNDDARADAEWLAAMMRAFESRPDVGMCASQVTLANDGRLDSAGMLLCGDGSSKQHGHLDSTEIHSRMEDSLLPSGSAAVYRREMLDEIGLFDESFFLYCEDTDLGLRARWAAWECLYVPEASVEHRYSQSAGKASGLKAYYVERNRLFVAVKNFPLRNLAEIPLYSCQRYFWHLVLALQGRGKAAEFRSAGHSPWELAWYVIRAHAGLFGWLPTLWKKRRAMKRRLTPKQFRCLMQRFAISPRQVAEL